MGDRTNQDLPPRQFFFENGSELNFWLTFMVIWRPGLRIWDPGTESKSRYLNRMSACRTTEAHAELHERAPNPMSAGDVREHGRTSSARENLMSIGESH